MKLQPTYERRGTMIYTEETRTEPARYFAECVTVNDAYKIVVLLNSQTEIINSGLGLDDNGDIR